MHGFGNMHSKNDSGKTVGCWHALVDQTLACELEEKEIIPNGTLMNIAFEGVRYIQIETLTGTDREQVNILNSQSM